MFNIITTNLPTVLVGAVVALGVAAVIWTMVRDKKKGKSSCGCSCANCPSAGMCHTKQEKMNAKDNGFF